MKSEVEMTLEKQTKGIVEIVNLSASNTNKIQVFTWNFLCISYDLFILKNKQKKQKQMN